MRRPPSPSIALALFLPWISLGACDLSTQLDGEPCEIDRDCGRKQSCARTDAERGAGLPGVCADDGECTTGKQLGCACIPDGYPEDCTNAALPSTIDSPMMTCDPTQLVCVVAVGGETSEG
jgi:hypothetical protein